MAVPPQAPPPVKAPVAAVTPDASPVILEAQKILKEIASQLPGTVQGLERQMMIGDSLTRTDETAKMKLLSLINHMLTRMFTINASDIDMGGYGTQGSIWYRVFGLLFAFVRPIRL